MSVVASRPASWPYSLSSRHWDELHMKEIHTADSTTEHSRLSEPSAYLFLYTGLHKDIIMHILNELEACSFPLLLRAFLRDGETY